MSCRQPRINEACEQCGLPPSRWRDCKVEHCPRQANVPRGTSRENKEDVERRASDEPLTEHIYGPDPSPLLKLLKRRAKAMAALRDELTRYDAHLERRDSQAADDMAGSVIDAAREVVKVRYGEDDT